MQMRGLYESIRSEVGDIEVARRGGLTKWFRENWVDIGRPKKGGGIKSAAKKLKKAAKGYLNVFLLKSSKNEQDQAFCHTKKKSKAQGVRGRPAM